MFTSITTFWTSYGPDLQSGAVVLSAIAAFVLITSSRQAARRRNTLDLILHHQSDGDLIDARESFNKLKAGATKLVVYADASKKGDPNFEVIRTVLNIHELTAVAIEEGVIDERVFRRWYNQTIINDYKETREFIEQVRLTYNIPNGFCEFEHLAKRWEADKAWNPTPSFIRRKLAAIARVLTA